MKKDSELNFDQVSDEMKSAACQWALAHVKGPMADRIRAEATAGSCKRVWCKPDNLCADCSGDDAPTRRKLDEALEDITDLSSRLETQRQVAEATRLEYVTHVTGLEEGAKSLREELAKVKAANIRINDELNRTTVLYQQATEREVQLNKRWSAWKDCIAKTAAWEALFKITTEGMTDTELVELGRKVVGYAQARAEIPEAERLKAELVEAYKKLQKVHEERNTARAGLAEMENAKVDLAQMKAELSLVKEDREAAWRRSKKMQGERDTAQAQVVEFDKRCSRLADDQNKAEMDLEAIKASIRQISSTPGGRSTQPIVHFINQVDYLKGQLATAIGLLSRWRISVEADRDVLSRDTDAFADKEYAEYLRAKLMQGLTPNATALQAEVERTDD